MSDFEAAIVRALTEFYHRHVAMFGVGCDMRVVCCYFHFGQLIVRRSRMCGLQALFGNDVIGQDLRRFVMCVMCLPYLPLTGGEPNEEGYSRVTVAFNGFVACIYEKVNNLVDVHLKNSVTPHLDKFIAYASRNYFDEESSFSVSQSQWNVSDLDDYRTNNHAEGRNNKVLVEVGQKANILDWIDNVIAVISDDIHVLNLVDFAPSQNTKGKKKAALDKDCNIGLWRHELDTGIISDMDFIRKLAFRIVSLNEYVSRDDDNRCIKLQVIC
jgi:hypothetical protein